MRRTTERIGLLACLLVFLIVALNTTSHAQSSIVANIISPRWSRSLPSNFCRKEQHTYCHFGSPALADVNLDGRLDIVVGTNGGYVVAFKDDGTLLWRTDVAPYFGMAAGTQQIHSSPAVADIDLDGFPEIAVGVGAVDWQVCTQGGVIVLDHKGRPEQGWPFLAVDEGIPPSGCRDTVWSTPALGDLDNNGDLEIVVGGTDKRLYAFHHDGTLLAGFPPDSYLARRFPTWLNLRGHLADTISSSPTLADLDQDGYLDIVIGSDEGNFDDSWGGDSGGWYCPYTLPNGWPPGFCGGALYAVNRKGQILPGFPRYFLDTVNSSPVSADTNLDGKTELYTGLGEFYYDNSPSRPNYGARVYALDYKSNPLPGWSGGRATGGPTPSSLAIGDIAGDEQPEIVIGAQDGRLYAWHLDGKVVSGFPMTPLDHYGQPHWGYELASSPVLGDADGDEKMEIFLNLTFSVAIIDGNGVQLTSQDRYSDPKPVYNAVGTFLNTPAIGDIDNDGRLELVATSSQIFVWDLDESTDRVEWPMWQRDAARSNAYNRAPFFFYSSQTMHLMHQSGEPGPAERRFTVSNQGDEPLLWSVSHTQDVSVFPDSGILEGGQRTEVDLQVDLDGMPDGHYQFGNLVFQANLPNGQTVNSSKPIPIKVTIGDIVYKFLPIASG